MSQEWYQKFVSDENLGGGVDNDNGNDNGNEMLFALVSAANFMGISKLLDLVVLKITFLLAGKNAEEIRQILRLPKMTAEEEKQAREDHKWIFED